MTMKKSKRLLIWAISLIVVQIIGLRLLDLQLVRGDTYRVSADENRFYTLQVPADRGVFFDRYNSPLAYNATRYFLVENPTHLYSAKQPVDRDRALAIMATDSARVVVENQRQYAVAEPVSHVLGYVGDVTAEELVRDPDKVLYKQYGKYGLEKTLDEQLQGKDGSEVYEINALGQRQRLLSSEQPVAGGSVQTTIDPYLSEVAYQALGDQQGVVLIADVLSGDILTLVSKPGFDPNKLSQQFLDAELEQDRVSYVQGLFRDEFQPLFNRAVSGVYPPGSVFKLVTAIAGLESESLTTTTQVTDEGVLRVGEYEYGNWYFRQFGGVEGDISLVRALARSNDIYFYKAAEWIGPTRLAEFARQFGFGSAVDIGLYPVAKGIVPDPSWKQAVIGERWYLGNTYHFGIGQGDMLVSPLQVLQLLVAFGHEGTLCQLHLLKGQDSECVELGMMAENIDVVLRGMIEACSPGGTAFPFFSRNGQIWTGENKPSVSEALSRGAAACKTGTAEFGGLDDQGFRSTHGWFVMLVEPQIDLTGRDEVGDADKASQEDGFEAVKDETEVAAEVKSEEALDLPSQRDQWLSKLSAAPLPERLAIVVLVESEEDDPYKEGSRNAAPVAKEILDWIEGQAEEKTEVPIEPPVENEDEVQE